jgi:Protein of unknown function DUF45
MARSATSSPRSRAPQIDVRRSTRRTRTVTAYRDGERIVVLIPARFSRADEQLWVGRMVGRLTAPLSGRRASPDAALFTRAKTLSSRYFGGRARPATVGWVSVMRTRWASCTPADGTIRVSSRLAQMPSWVLDYVLMHELAHLLVPGHGADFWALVNRYPRTERARGYLDGVSSAANLGIAEGAIDD